LGKIRAKDLFMLWIKNKPDERMKDIKCPECNSKYIIKKGKRKKAFGFAQLYRCKECGTTFADKTFKHRTYPARVVYSAINYYNLGHTLDETSKLLNQKFKLKTSKTTVHSWLKTFQDICPISPIRTNFSFYEIQARKPRPLGLG